MIKTMLNTIRDAVLIPCVAFATILLIATTLLWAATAPFSWLSHADDRAALSQIDKVIEIYTEEYDRTINDIFKLREGASIRLNADKPIQSLVESRIEIAKSIIENKVEKNKILASIISRCNGPFKLTIYFFDIISCEDYRSI